MRAPLARPAADDPARLAARAGWSRGSTSPRTTSRAPGASCKPGHSVTWPPAPNARRRRPRRSPPPQHLLGHGVADGPPRRAAAGRPGARCVVVSRLLHRRARARSIDAVGAAARPRRPRQPLPRPRGLRGHRRRDRRRAGTSGSGAAPTTSRSRSTGSPTSRSASPSPPRTDLVPAIRGPLEDLYPDVELIEQSTAAPPGRSCVVRLKKRASFVLSIQTTRNYEHAFAESLVALLSTRERRAHRPARPHAGAGFVHRRARRLLKRRERALQHADHRDPGELGIDSVVEAKELKGALELQHRSLLYFDLRVTGRDPTTVRRVAGLFSQLRSENELVAPRDARCAGALYAAPDRAGAAQPAPRAGAPACSRPRSSRRCGSSRARASSTPGFRARPSAARSRRRRSTATPARMLLRDERGPVSIAPADRKYGHALIGGQGGGKSSVMARHFANDARDPDRAVDPDRPQGPARRALPRPRARRADGPLPRPRPPRDRHQPADDRRQPGRPRRRLPAGADRGQPARRDPGRVGLLPAPGRRRRLRRRARRRRSGTSTACSTSGDSPYRDERRPPPRADPRRRLRTRTTGDASSPPCSPTAASPPRRSTRRATSSSGSSPPARSTRSCATPSRSTSKASSSAARS